MRGLTRVKKRGNLTNVVKKTTEKHTKIGGTMIIKELNTHRKYDAHLDSLASPVELAAFDGASFILALSIAHKRLTTDPTATHSWVHIRELVAEILEDYDYDLDKLEAFIESMPAHRRLNDNVTMFEIVLKDTPLLSWQISGACINGKVLSLGLQYSEDSDDEMKSVEITADQYDALRWFSIRIIPFLER